MPHVAVILSGCGFLDGSEIYETVITLLSLDKQNVSYQCFAPNIKQNQVMNYLTGESSHEERNVLVEAARLARGEIKDIIHADPQQFDAMIFPGGFGAASNLCSFAQQGANSTINPDVKRFASEMLKAKKPAGFICIAPALIPQITDQTITLTIGNDPNTAEAITTLGATHQNCPVDDIVIDETHRVVTTPAYMLGKRISEVAIGIEKLVYKVISLINKE